MTLNIIESASPLNITHIQIMLYGAPSTHKTSVACSTEKPLLINFDGVQNALKAFGRPDSVHVVSQRPDAQQMDWENLRKMTKTELGSYRTIVIDTAGRMVDCIGAYVEARLGIPPSSTFKYYGEIKTQAISFFRLINEIGLDIVFVAHEKNEELRKKTVISPAIAGGSGGEIYRDCVVIGYMAASARRGEVSLDFELDESRVAKNHGLPEYIVPKLEAEPLFLAGIISAVKSSLMKKPEVSPLEAEIIKMLESEDVNGAIVAVQESANGLPPAIVKRIKARIAGKAKVMNLVWSGTSYAPGEAK